MIFTEFRRWLNRTFKQSQHAPIRRRSARLTMDPLEVRQVPSISISLNEHSFKEGTNSTYQVGEFTDDTYFANSTYSSLINWGDGTSSTGTATQVNVQGSTATYAVNGSHTYSEAGHFTVTLTVDESGGDGDSASQAIDPPVGGDSLTPVSAGATATEGTAFTGTVATFSDTNTISTSDEFSATINWGDGASNDVGTVSGGGGTFTVSGSHVYADELTGSLSVTLTQVTSGSATATANGDAAVGEGDLLVAGSASVTATEGTPFSGTVATFSDSTYPTNGTGDFSATINWGDGTSNDVGTVGGGGGTFSVSGIHTYSDEGSYSISVTLNDDAPGTATATASGDANVGDADDFFYSSTPISISGTEGASFSGTLTTFADSYSGHADASDFSATINWGDGTSTAGTVTAGAPVFEIIPIDNRLETGSFTLAYTPYSVSGSHAYADEGDFSVSVTLNDDPPGIATATEYGTASIADADSLTVASAPSIGGTEGTAFSGTLATFTDSYTGHADGSDFNATINWGDGTSNDAGTVTGGSGAFTVSGSHIYADEGNFSVSVTLNDDSPGTATATANSAAIIVEGDSLVAGSAGVTATEGTVFSGTVATFSDSTYPANVPGDFSATINWGDGTSNGVGTVGGGSGTFSVSGSHTYADEGNFSISVTLNDDAPSTVTATASGTASVADGDSLLALGATATPTEGTAYTGALATFYDFTYPSNSPGDFSATINWGDGTSNDVGTVTGGGGFFTVSGNHTYADEGNFSISVTLNDDSPGTASATDNGTATVAEADSLTPSGVSITPTEGTTFSGTVATFSDTYANSPDDFNATISWGDGSTSVGTITGASLNQAIFAIGTIGSGGTTFTVSGSHSYADEGTYSVSVTLNDDSPGTATATAYSTATVAEGDSFTPQGLTISGTEGTTFSGVAATFADTYANNSPDDFSASINWGDGTSTTNEITGACGTFSVHGSHTYLASGSFTVSVSIADDDAGTATATANSTFTESGNVVVYGTPSADTLTLMRTAGSGFGNITYILDGGTPVSLTGVHSFSFAGLGGNDTMNVDLTNGAPLMIGNVSFDGGPGAQEFNAFNLNAANLPVGTATNHFYFVDGQRMLFVNTQATNLTAATAVQEFGGPDTADRGTAFTGLTANERYVEALYLDELGRPASRSEIDSNWPAALSGTALTATQQQSIAGEIDRSPEARDHLVKGWYLTYLGRPAVGGEESFWVNKLLAFNNGQQPYAEETVLSMFLSDPNGGFYKAHTTVGASVADNGHQFVAALYQALLNRPASPSEVASWDTIFNQSSSGNYFGVAFGFLTGTEFRRDQFEGYYDALLLRPGDAGLSGWVTQTMYNPSTNSNILADLTTVRTGFESTNNEFYNEAQII